MKLTLAIAFSLLVSVGFAQEKKSKYIIAYTTGKGSTIQAYPIQKLTHIIYSFLKLQNDTLTFHDTAQENSLKQLVALKQKHPQLKIMVSIGGWGGCAPCSDYVASAQWRQNFAHSTVALFKKYGIDGLDLDWEYPAIEGYPGHKYTIEDKNNFTELVKTLRNAMGKQYILSFAAGGFEQYLKNSIDWQAVTPLVDFVNLMTYDLVGGYSTVTGHHTPLNHYRPGQQSTSKCVDWLLKNKVPSQKLIIGAAFYARVWENVADSNHGLYNSGKFKEGISYKNFVSYFSKSKGFIYFWDIKSQAPYYYNPSQQLFATFDDESSIKAKTKYLQTKNLGGIMFWELIDDKPNGGLVDEIYKNLK